VINFVGWTIPILGGKSIETHVFDFEFSADLKKLDYSIAGFFVAQVARKSPKFGPPSVPIHDESDVVEFLFKDEWLVHKCFDYIP
jgi:hypothetical protein